MFPLGHIGVGYLFLSFVERGWRHHPPQGVALPWLIAGTLLPDLIDKPLAWAGGLLPSGRSLAHSLLFAIPLIVVISGWLWQHRKSAEGIGFSVGYGSHLLTDVVLPLGTPFDRMRFLLWPLYPAPVYESEIPTTLELTESLLLEVPLGFFIVGLWVVDGRPGSKAVHRLGSQVKDWVRSRLG